jgi:hypothetical protein
VPNAQQHDPETLDTPICAAVERDLQLSVADLLAPDGRPSTTEPSV